MPSHPHADVFCGPYSRRGSRSARSGRSQCSAADIINVPGTQVLKGCKVRIGGPFLAGLKLGLLVGVIAGLVSLGTPMDSPESFLGGGLGLNSSVVAVQPILIGVLFGSLTLVLVVCFDWVVRWTARPPRNDHERDPHVNRELRRWRKWLG
jgi:hypothetical protein